MDPENPFIWCGTGGGKDPDFPDEYPLRHPSWILRSNNNLKIDELAVAVALTLAWVIDPEVETNVPYQKPGEEVFNNVHMTGQEIRDTVKVLVGSPRGRVILASYCDERLREAIVDALVHVTASAKSGTFPMPPDQEE